MNNIASRGADCEVERGAQPGGVQHVQRGEGDDLRSHREAKDVHWSPGHGREFTGGNFRNLFEVNIVEWGD